MPSSARPRSAKPSAGSPVSAGGWWGDGPPPTDRWPGVTLPLDDGGGRYRFDAEQADRVCGFFPRFCSHSKGAFAGQSFALLDYQVQLILRPLFGWIRVSDGHRRFQKAYIQIPKKNGKTQLIAGLALYMLLCDNEPGAEVYVAAADREQARILFAAAKAMVEANPKLASRLVVYRNSIVRADDATAFFQVLSSEAATKHGPNIHCLIIDELHAQPDRELFETLTRGVVARRQPLILEITTAGDDEESICHEEYDYAKRILSGVVEDERFLPVIFEATDKDDWQAPATWDRVNPGLGITITRETFQGFAREAANEPRKRNDFLRYHLNRWVNQAVAWIPLEWWDASAVAALEGLEELPCAAGLDMAQKIDLAAFVVAFRRRLAAPITVPTGDQAVEPSAVPRSLNYSVALVPFFWIPEATMFEREREDRVPYSQWMASGLLTVTEGDTIDYDRIFRDITEKIVPRFPKLKGGEIGFDPAFATDIAQKLAAAGLTMIEVLQNYKHLSEPCYLFEGLLKAKRIEHDGHRVLRSHVANVAVKRDDAGRIRPVKPRQSRKRIDGVVASLMGLKLLTTQPDAPRASIYQSRGLLTL